MVDVPGESPLERKNTHKPRPHLSGSCFRFSHDLSISAVHVSLERRHHQHTDGGTLPNSHDECHNTPMLRSLFLCSCLRVVCACLRKCRQHGDVDIAVDTHYKLRYTHMGYLCICAQLFVYKGQVNNDRSHMLDLVHAYPSSNRFA